MTLKQLLTELGFAGGVAIRYSDDIDLVIFFMNYNSHNPAVTQSGVIISVGTAPVRTHGKIQDDRTYNPLYGRRDFDLNHPESLSQIDEYLQTMVDKCEVRRGKCWTKGNTPTTSPFKVS